MLAQAIVSTMLVVVITVGTFRPISVTAAFPTQMSD
jgi:hypothetical protein